MKYELFDFQTRAVADLLKKMESMKNSYETDGSLSAVALTAPTGSGKTVISAAVAEGLFFGNDTYAGDDRAVILWLSDSPSLNDQTMMRFEEATDLIGVTNMKAIGPDFAKNHSKLMPGTIYFLNRQLLGKGKKLTNEAEGGRSFYDVLNATIEDSDIHLYLFIDEAHRGMGTGADKGTSDSANKTIYSIIIDGQDGINKPMPCVVGISATPERFNDAMKGRKNRDIKAGVNVPVADVRASGLIKDTIELRTPKKSTDTKHQDLTQACVKLAKSSKLWKDYCTTNGVFPFIVPLMVVQVEDKVTKDTLDALCSQIHKVLPWLDISECFANVFGEHEDIVIPSGKIPYVRPEEVAKRTEIRVLFAKDAVSTGWDCPRAEVIYSRRKRNDPTYIARLIGRMIRTPMARRIDSVEELNTVACYLPEYDATTVETVVEKLKEDNVAVATTSVVKNPADVKFFGETKKYIEDKLAKKQAIETSAPDSSGTATGTSVVRDTPVTYGTKKPEDVVSGTEFAVNIDDTFTVVLDDIEENTDELTEALERIPKVDSNAIKASFESIITRQVRHDKPNHFLDLWDCIDIISSDIDMDADLDSKIQVEFYNNIEAEIARHPAEFKRSVNDIKSTTVTVKRIDPLTGEAFEDHEELVENDSERLTNYYKHAVSVFAGASDLIKYCINKRMTEQFDSDSQAICRLAAVGYCMEIVQAMEVWAENKTDELLSAYGPMRYAVSEENKTKWDRIEGNTKPFIERTLSVQASITKQNKEHEKYPKHIISDELGWSYHNLNDIERKVVNTELARPLNVAWYRNQPRNLNASLSIPYQLNGEWENMYPDFIFFQKLPDGRVIRSIVDPHGDWLGDSIAKLKGYVAYLKDHPDIFGSVLAVTDEKGGEYRYLDLTQAPVQTAIEKFTGTSAKELFTGNLSELYTVKE